MNVPRLQIGDSLMLVVDVQDKLLVKMPDAQGLVRDVGFLMDVASILQIPKIATEQYPKGLGPTTAEIARRLPAKRPEKTSFSCCGAAGLLDEIRAARRSTLVVTGMETHVCVMQTALDLLSEGFTVFLPVDAIQSRCWFDHEIALRRLEKAGAILTTVEATAFEWLGSSGHPSFKTISKMIQERMASLPSSGTPVNSRAPR